MQKNNKGEKMMETIKEVLSLLGTLGVPPILVIALYCFRHCLKIAKQIEILQKAQKAQMRAQLLKDYEIYMDRDYVLQIELDEWINQYNAYHELVGPNAVLDDRKENLLKLKTHK